MVRTRKATALGAGAAQGWQKARAFSHWSMKHSKLDSIAAVARTAARARFKFSEQNFFGANFLRTFSFRFFGAEISGQGFFQAAGRIVEKAGTCG
jgi:hypothetical protein